MKKTFRCYKLTTSSLVDLLWLHKRWRTTSQAWRAMGDHGFWVREVTGSYPGGNYFWRGQYRRRWPETSCSVRVNKLTLMWVRLRNPWQKVRFYIALWKWYKNYVQGIAKSRKSAHLREHENTGGKCMRDWEKYCILSSLKIHFRQISINFAFDNHLAFLM